MNSKIYSQLLGVAQVYIKNMVKDGSDVDIQQIFEFLSLHVADLRKSDVLSILQELAYKGIVDYDRVTAKFRRPNK